MNLFKGCDIERRSWSRRILSDDYESPPPQIYQQHTYIATHSENDLKIGRTDLLQQLKSQKEGHIKKGKRHGQELNCYSYQQVGGTYMH